MSKLAKISQTQAINVMDNNLKKIKMFLGADTCLLLSYDLDKDMAMQKMRVDRVGGIKIIKGCKTFIFNKDYEDDEVSVLSMYTELQKDIYNILPIGKKYDMVIVPSRK